MNKSKKSIQSIVKYLRELSVVIAGIGFTVGIGLWVNNSNNKKDLERYLFAIEFELEENVKKLSCSKIGVSSSNLVNFST